MYIISLEGCSSWKPSNLCKEVKVRPVWGGVRHYCGLYWVRPLASCCNSELSPFVEIAQDSFFLLIKSQFVSEIGSILNMAGQPQHLYTGQFSDRCCHLCSPWWSWRFHDLGPWPLEQCSLFAVHTYAQRETSHTLFSILRYKTCPISR